MVEHSQADVEIWTDTLTFIQLACGRIDPEEPIDLGTIHWRGDAESGERAARNLRFTMKPKVMLRVSRSSGSAAATKNRPVLAVWVDTLKPTG